MQTPFEFTDRDFQHSAYTGLTRGHWSACAEEILARSEAHKLPGGFRYRFPGRPSMSGKDSDELEGFARVFLLAAFRIGERDKVSELVASRFRESFESAANALKRRESTPWPEISNMSQSLVEAASIAIGLAVTRDMLWDRLSDDARDAITQWMQPSIGVRVHNNNWILFPALVGAFLKSVGREFTGIDSAIARGLETIGEWHVGGGWYTDGPHGPVDYYNAWAFHYYAPLLTYLVNDHTDSFNIRARLRQFLPGYAQWFSKSGAPLYFGRSLIYRFATIAPFWTAELIGANPLNPGETRRICSSVLDYFVGQGAIGESGLSLGWHSALPNIAQVYSGPGSPLWAAKAFVGLLMSADSEVWTSPEQYHQRPPASDPAPVDNTGLMVSASRDNDIVRLHNGMRHRVPAAPWRDDPMYARFSYSTVTAPTQSLRIPDNSFGVILRGAQCSFRGPLRTSNIRWNCIIGSYWPLRVPRPLLRWPFETNRVRRALRLSAKRVGSMTVSYVFIISGDVEIRLFHISGGVEGQRVICTGWPVWGQNETSRMPDRATISGSSIESHLKIYQGFRSVSTEFIRERSPFGYGCDVPCATGSLSGGPQGDLFIAAVSLVPKGSSFCFEDKVDLRQIEDKLMVWWKEDGARQQIAVPTDPPVVST